LVSHFVDRWKEKEKQSSIVSKIKSVGKPPQNLKQQISLVIQRMDAQSKTLDIAVNRFEGRDTDIFNRVVRALSERDEARANVLASELSEIRKVEKMLMPASLALQGVSMRLNTVSEVGDLVTILSPAKSVLSNIRSEMCGILPEAGQELGNIGSLLSDIVISTNQATEMPVSVGDSSPEAEEILQEAEQAVEKRLKERLPQVSTARPEKKLTSIET